MARATGCSLPCSAEAAILNAAVERGLELFAVDHFQSISGRGIRATVDGKLILLGNQRLMQRELVSVGDAASQVESLEKQAKTTLTSSRCISR